MIGTLFRYLVDLIPQLWDLILVNIHKKLQKLSGILFRGSYSVYPNKNAKDNKDDQKWGEWIDGFS